MCTCITSGDFLGLATDRAQLMSANCGKIHKDKDNYMEQAGRYTFEGQRELLQGSRGHVLYQVSFKVRPTCQLFVYIFIYLFIIV